MANAEIYFAIFLFLLNFLSGVAEWNTKDYLKKENSLIKPYSDGRWDFVGSTIVSNSYVRLTPDHQSRKGAIFNNLRSYVPNWELHVHFKVHGSGNDLFGDGFAIWYTKEKLMLGPVFGGKDYFTGLGIFLDTYSNHNGPHNHGHPYISAMVGNGSAHYDHDRDGTHTEVAGCESHFRKSAHETYIAIRYEKKKLTVSTDIEGKNAWKECFSVEGVRLPTGYYFGASAATGQLADNHDIISMKLYDIGLDEEKAEDYENIDPSADMFAPPRDHVEDEKRSFMSSRLTGWRFLLIIIVGIIGVGVCAMVGFIIYTKRQEDARKRFY
ncbi:hypothetical protein CAPTEDRAFT_227830 [Capitella teleta]|uniref:L-type lectin-like domain-containing protein n=1 Tax=Capitella teleta TaxID=283909 RepID=R7V8U1_CAPTE|nr:hypothetical protein CAPTEDRAFT_227830 [Capitella teleta]|eukprot:ELU14932.1 hypothetical protein CAPTEDRAFT_227830 [Capitella teleta]